MQTLIVDAVLMGMDMHLYTKILVAVDGSDCSRVAAERAIGLTKAFDARLLFLTVSPDWKSIGLSELAYGHLEDEYPARAEASASIVLDEACRPAIEAGIDYIRMHVTGARPYEGILSSADEHNCDLIVVGSHGRSGAARLLLGSQASKIVSLSPISVLVARKG